MPDNIVGVYQQDRYSNGGSKGTVAAVTFDGGDDLDAGRRAERHALHRRPFQRASDPWISFGPDGDAARDEPRHRPRPADRRRSATTAWPTTARPTAASPGRPRSCSSPRPTGALPQRQELDHRGPERRGLRLRRLGSRCRRPRGSVADPENAIGLGFKGPIYFARTTNGGDTWEPARKIYETGANKQTIGNQIVVRPQGELFDFFGDIVNSSQPPRRHRPGQALLHPSPTIAARHGRKPTRVDDQLPMSLIREDTHDRPRAGAVPDPTDRAPARSAAATSSRRWRSTRPTATCTPSGWTPASAASRPAPSERDSIAFSQSTDGGQTWSPPIKVNETPTGEPNSEQPGVHALGRTSTATARSR